MTAPVLVDHFFRHQYGHLVATLARRVGMQHVADVEDAVQAALLTALESWPVAGLPDVPEAWLFRVASNNMIDMLRTRKRRGALLERYEATSTAAQTMPYLAGELQDDLLRMLFVCCDPAIVGDSQLVFALKTLCGFDVREIAQRLFISEANVYKRLSRARDRLRERPPSEHDLEDAQLIARLPAVINILYVLFTEGYLSSHAETAIRRELCDEAIRLAAVLAEHPLGQATETFALLGLMHLHRARMSARQDAVAGLILLEEQDRGLWDQSQIHTGLAWLARSAQGEVVSRYHLEAGIAAEHCLAPSFDQTRWDKIAAHYEQLERLAPSGIHTLNRALAVAEGQGPAAGLAVLEGFEPPRWLESSFLWSATLADLHRRSGNATQAARHRAVALELAPSEAIRTSLLRRLQNASTNP